MKLNKIFFAAVAAIALAFASCDDPIEGPHGPGFGEDTTVVTVDTTAQAVTVAEALEIIKGLEAGAATTEKYKLTGTITNVKTAAANVPSQYNNINFTLQDETGSIDCFYTNYLNNEPFTSADQIPNLGSVVEVIGTLKAYAKNDNVTPEVANGWINKIIKEGEGFDISTATEVTIAQAIEIVNGLAAGAQTNEYYVINGTVDKVLTANDKVAQYGNINLNVKDATGTLACYYTNYLDNKAFTSADQVPAVGATVKLCGQLKSYAKDDKVTPELLNGWFVSIDNSTAKEEDTNEPTPIKATVAEFNAAAESNEVYYELTGVISGTIQTTYGNFDLVDATGTVYVYGLTAKFISVGNTNNDQSYASLGLNAGDTVTIRGMRGSYKEKIEVMGAYYVSHKAGQGGDTNPGGDTPGGDVTPGTANVTVADGVITLDFTANPLGLTAELALKAAQTYDLGTTGYKITFDGSGNTTSGTKVLNNQFRMYKNTTFTIAAPEGVNMASIAFVTAGVVGSSDYSTNNLSVVTGGGTIATDGANGTWTGPANSVTFTNNNQVRINKLVITPAN